MFQKFNRFYKAISVCPKKYFIEFSFACISELNFLEFVSYRPIIPYFLYNI